MNVELKGTVHALFAEEQISDNYKKKQVVITVDENTSYPQQIVCHAGNTKIDLLNGINHGDSVTATCNLKGREHNGKYYNSLEIWKLTKN